MALTKMVETERASAGCENGILAIELPKTKRVADDLEVSINIELKQGIDI